MTLVRRTELEAERQDRGEFAAFEPAYLHNLAQVTYQFDWRNSPRGAPSRERLGVRLRIADATQRHVAIPERRCNLAFNLAEVLWYLAGSRELDPIAYYAPTIARYSRDGQSLCGTAYGARIFTYGDRALHQWRNVTRVLRADPDSKRAVIQLFDPAELVDEHNIDVACTLGLQFLVRGGRLDCVGFMRANDAFRGMVSDVFSFTFLQEVMARELGLDAGAYIHQVGSMHVYDHDYARAQAVLRAQHSWQPSGHRYPAMPPGDNWPHIREVLAWEARLRRNERRLGARELAALDLPDYWRHVLAIFEYQRQLRHDDQVDASVLEAIPPLFRLMLANRWPAR